MHDNDANFKNTSDRDQETTGDMGHLSSNNSDGLVILSNLGDLKLLPHPIRIKRQLSGDAVVQPHNSLVSSQSTLDTYKHTHMASI